jgi:hypothetical protein
MKRTLLGSLIVCLIGACGEYTGTAEPAVGAEAGSSSPIDAGFTGVDGGSIADGTVDASLQDATIDPDAGDAGDAAGPSIIFVSGQAGNDANAGTSPDRPLKTLGAAIGFASLGKIAEIHLCSGEYEISGLQLTSSLTIRGGYLCNQWQRPEGFGKAGNFSALTKTALKLTPALMTRTAAISLSKGKFIFDGLDVLTEEFGTTIRGDQGAEIEVRDTRMINARSGRAIEVDSGQLALIGIELRGSNTGVLAKDTVGRIQDTLIDTGSATSVQPSIGHTLIDIDFASRTQAAFEVDRIAMRYDGGFGDASTSPGYAVFTGIRARGAVTNQVIIRNATIEAGGKLYSQESSIFAYGIASEGPLLNVERTSVLFSPFEGIGVSVYGINANEVIASNYAFRSLSATSVGLQGVNVRLAHASMIGQLGVVAGSDLTLNNSVFGNYGPYGVGACIGVNAILQGYQNNYFATTEAGVRSTGQGGCRPEQLGMFAKLNLGNNRMGAAVFRSVFDLRLQPSLEGCMVGRGGTPLMPPVTLDIEGTSRHPAHPSLGAFEASLMQCPVP